MTFSEWIVKHRISAAALEDLNEVLIPPLKTGRNEGSEAHVMSLVRLEAAKKGMYLWRNNVGAGVLQDGSYLRWGLGNDSKALNVVLKSADLIGIRKHQVTAADVGRTLGIFVSRECKKIGWRYSASPEELAQLRWAALIESMGGDAQIVTGVGSL